MKRYKLLKDLPTFKAGEKFFINGRGSLVYDDNPAIIAYSASTLNKFPNILNDWFEEIKESTRWRGEIGEIYWWFNDSYGYTTSKTENRDIVDNHRYRLGNYFKTEAEAEKYGEYLEALQVIKDDTGGFKPDWKNWSQDKYYGYYNHDDSCLDWDNALNYQSQGAVYFKTIEDLKESFEKHHKEWLTTLGVEE